MQNKVSKFSFIIFNSFIYYTITNSLIIPFLINYYGNESFIYALLFSLLGIIIFLIYKPQIRLYNKLLNSIIMRYIIALYLLVFIIILIYMSTIVIKQFYPLTNEVYFYLLFLIVGSFLAYYGIHGLVSLATPIFLFIPVLIIIPIIFSERELDYTLALPFDFSQNIFPLLMLSIIPLDIVLQTQFLQVKKNNTFSRMSLITPLFISMFLVGLNLLTTISTFSIGFLKVCELPGFIIYDSLKISKNFDNYDVVLIFFVTATSIFKIGFNIAAIRILLHFKNTTSRYINLILISLTLLVLLMMYHIKLTDFININFYILLFFLVIFIIYYIYMRFTYETNK